MVNCGFGLSVKAHPQALTISQCRIKNLIQLVKVKLLGFDSNIISSLCAIGAKQLAVRSLLCWMVFGGFVASWLYAVLCLVCMGVVGE